MPFQPSSFPAACKSCSVRIFLNLQKKRNPEQFLRENIFIRFILTFTNSEIAIGL